MFYSVTRIDMDGNLVHITIHTRLIRFLTIKNFEVRAKLFIKTMSF